MAVTDFNLTACHALKLFPGSGHAKPTHCRCGADRYHLLEYSGGAGSEREGWCAARTDGPAFESTSAFLLPRSTPPPPVARIAAGTHRLHALRRASLLRDSEPGPFSGASGGAQDSAARCGSLAVDSGPKPLCHRSRANFRSQSLPVLFPEKHSSSHLSSPLAPEAPSWSLNMPQFRRVPEWA